ALVVSHGVWAAARSSRIPSLMVTGLSLVTAATRWTPAGPTASASAAAQRRCRWPLRKGRSRVCFCWICCWLAIGVSLPFALDRPPLPQAGYGPKPGRARRSSRDRIGRRGLTVHRLIPVSVQLAETDVTCRAGTLHRLPVPDA